jgi:Flp pilus assembly protein CpaB
MTAPSLAGVLATRQGSLLLALLCAVSAAAVLIFALDRFKTNVARPLPQATVLVSTGEIEKGMTGQQIAAHHLYKATPVTADQVTAGAIGNAAQIAGATASTNILPGQQLIGADFSTIVGVDQVLAPDQRAVEISVGQAPGATDITQSGSHVDIYAVGGTSTVATGNAGKGDGLSGGTQGTAAEQPLATNVLVLKPATAAPVTIGNQSVSGGTLVLALKRSLVSTVINHNGALYLALRPSKNGPSVISPTSDHGAQP